MANRRPNALEVLGAYVLGASVISDAPKEVQELAERARKLSSFELASDRQFRIWDNATGKRNITWSSGIA